MFFGNKNKKKTFDPEKKKPVLRVSICTGEQVAGFRDLQTGTFQEVMLIRDADDLDEFMNLYGIHGEIEKTY